MSEMIVVQSTLDPAIPGIVAREVAEVINEVTGFRATHELINGSLARVDVDGPLQVAGVPFGCCWLSILVDQEYISLNLMPYATHPEAFPPVPAVLDALDKCLTDAVEVCFELRNPECFDQLAGALNRLGMRGLVRIEATK